MIRGQLINLEEEGRINVNDERQSFSDQHLLISHCDDRKVTSRITASRCRVIYKEINCLLVLKGIFRCKFNPRSGSEIKLADR